MRSKIVKSENIIPVNNYGVFVQALSSKFSGRRSATADLHPVENPFI